MIVDSSALLAIVFDEDDARRYTDAIEHADTTRVSAGNLLEACIVVDRAPSGLAGRLFDRLIRESQIEIVPVTADHVAIARDAHQQFGRGSAHRAKLNFGDCFAYALAYAADEPLLFKGDDFSETDIRPVLD